MEHITALRKARMRQGWTLTEAAEKLYAVCDGNISIKGDVNDKMLGKWERGEHFPGPRYRRKLADLYAMPIDELFPQEDRLNRRTAVKLVGFTAAGLTLAGSTLDAYGSVLDLAWKSYYTGNVAETQGTVALWQQHLGGTIPTLHGKSQQSIQALLCKFHQLASVIARDQKNFALAYQEANQAYALASSLDNPELMASTLNRRARLYTEMGHPDLAVVDLEQALPYAERSQSPLHFYVKLAMADTYSRAYPQDANRQQKSFELLDQIESAVRSHSVLEGDGSYMKIDVPGTFMIRGDVERRFGQLEKAEESLQIVEASLPKTFVRWKGNLLVSQAALAFADNEAEKAALLAKEAVDIIGKTGSSVNREKVQHLYQDMAATYDSPAVKMLGEVLAV